MQFADDIDALADEEQELKPLLKASTKSAQVKIENKYCEDQINEKQLMACRVLSR